MPYKMPLHCNVLILAACPKRATQRLSIRDCTFRVILWLKVQNDPSCCIAGQPSSFCSVCMRIGFKHVRATCTPRVPRPIHLKVLYSLKRKMGPLWVAEAPTEPSRIRNRSRWSRDVFVVKPANTTRTFENPHHARALALHHRIDLSKLKYSIKNANNWPGSYRTPNPHW